MWLQNLWADVDVTWNTLWITAARVSVRMQIHGYCVSICRSVRLSVSPSKVGSVTRRMLNLGSRKQRATTAKGHRIFTAKDYGKIPTGSLPTSALNKGGVCYNRRFLTSIAQYLRNGCLLPCTGGAIWWMLTGWRPGVVNWSGGVFVSCIPRVQLSVNAC